MLDEVGSTGGMVAEPAQVSAESSKGTAAPAAAPAPLTVTFRNGVPGTPAESPEMRYLRQTRNAAVFVAVVVGIVLALNLIVGIYLGSQLSKLNSAVNGGGSSNCMSLGGTDPSC